MDVRDKEGRGEGFVGVKKGFAVMTLGFARGNGNKDGGESGTEKCDEEVKRRGRSQRRWGIMDASGDRARGDSEVRSAMMQVKMGWRAQ